MKGDLLELTITGMSKDAAAGAAGLKQLTGLVADAIKDMTAPDKVGNKPELDAADKALLALLRKIQVKTEGAKTTVTATLTPADVMTIMEQMPMGDLLDGLTAPADDEPGALPGGVVPNGPVNGPGIMVNPVPPGPIPQPMPR
jgi:hypothetical protein